MITTKLMLESLHSWVTVHSRSLEDYLRHYPYSPYISVDTSHSLRQKIADIINHIVTLIAPQHVPHLAHHQLRSPSLLSHTEINTLCQVKTLLDDIKILFLTVSTIKTIQVGRILNTLEAAIRLTSLPVQEMAMGRPTHSPRNRSFDQIRHQQRPRSSFMERYEKELNKKSNEEERTGKVRAQLYEEMRQDLRKRAEKLEQNRPKRVISDYRTVLSKQLPPRDNRKRVNLSPRIFQKAYEPEKRNVHQKRIFKYLEEDLSERKKRREQLQRNQFLCEPFEPLETFETPKRQKFRTLPSTQQRSPSRKKQEQFWENQLPEYQLNEGELQPLKRQLDERLKLSKIKHLNEENQQGDWEQFEKDSNENENPISTNLDDSLQLMKEQQALNRTGEFNPIPITIVQELQQYSFSHD